MRRLLIAVTFGVLCLGPWAVATPALAAPAPVSASASANSLQALQQLETVSYQAATSFYLYCVLNRDPQHIKKAQAQVTAGEARVKSLNNPGISSKWTTFKQAIANADFTSEGMVENQSLIAVDSAHSALAQALRSSRTEQRLSTNIATDKMSDMLYDQHVLMQVMTAAYLRKSADYFGGSIVQSQGPQVEIDLLANKFTAQQDALMKHYAKKAEVATLLREVNTKWIFIRKSFINFNENNVPFIVGRYNEQINERLLLAYEKLQ